MVNAFSGLITAFVNIYAAQGGTYGAASYSALAVAAVSTASSEAVDADLFESRFGFWA